MEETSFHPQQNWTPRGPNAENIGMAEELQEKPCPDRLSLA